MQVFPSQVFVSKPTFSGTAILQTKPLSDLMHDINVDGKSPTTKEQKILKLFQDADESVDITYKDQGWHNKYYKAFICDTNKKSKEIFERAKKLGIKAFHIRHPKDAMEANQLAVPFLKRIMELFANAEELLGYIAKQSGAKNARQAINDIQDQVLKSHKAKISMRTSKTEAIV